MAGQAERAGRWFRVSTGGQDEAQQEPDVDAWCNERGYVTSEAATWRVRASAFHGKHEAELAEAMAAMRDGRISVLVVWRSDRIDRQERLGEMIKEAGGYGGRIEFAREPELNALAGLGGRLMPVIKGYMNAEESVVKADRVRKAKAAKAAAGFWTGSVPFGYRLRCQVDGCGAVTSGSGPRQVCSKQHGKRPEIDSEAAATVREIFRLYVAGRTLRQICAELDSAGRRPQAGGTWWLVAVSNILSNPSYSGQAANGAELPAIVTADVWLEAQRQSEVRGTRKGRKSGPTAMLTGLLSCARCGGPMWRTVSSYRKAGTPVSRAYYRCHGNSHGTSGRSDACGMSLPLEAVEAEVSALVLAQLARGNVTATRTVAARSWDAEVSEACLAMARLPVDHHAGRITTAELIAESKRLGELIAELEARPELPEHEVVVDTGHTSADHWEAASEDERRTFLRQAGWSFTADKTGSRYSATVLVKLASELVPGRYGLTA